MLNNLSNGFLYFEEGNTTFYYRKIDMLRYFFIASVKTDKFEKDTLRVTSKYDIYSKVVSLHDYSGTNTEKYLGKSITDAINSIGWKSLPFYAATHIFKGSIKELNPVASSYSISNADSIIKNYIDNFNFEDYEKGKVATSTPKKRQL